jgi:hypothetical protein
LSQLINKVLSSSGTGGIEYKTTIPKIDHLTTFLEALTKDTMFLIENKTKGTKEIVEFKLGWGLYCDYKAKGDDVTVEILKASQAAKVLYGQQTP